MVCKLLIEVKLEGDDVVLSNCKQVRIKGEDKLQLIHSQCFDQMRVTSVSEPKNEGKGVSRDRHLNREQLEALVSGFEMQRKRQRV